MTMLKNCRLDFLQVLISEKVCALKFDHLFVFFQCLAAAHRIWENVWWMSKGPDFNGKAAHFSHQGIKKWLMIAFTKDRKNFEIFSKSFMTACLLFMFVFLPALMLWNLLFLYVSLLYPLPCMPIFPSFFIRVYLIITFPFLFQSTCRLPAFNMSLMVIKTPALLFLKNLETIPDMLTWIYSARHLFTEQGRIRFQVFSMWVCERVCIREGR